MRPTIHTLVLSLSLSASAPFVCAMENPQEDGWETTIQGAVLSPQISASASADTETPLPNLSIDEITDSLFEYLFDKDTVFEEDEIQTFDYYKNAAEQGDPKAQLYLGVLYQAKFLESRNEDLQDKNTALKWIQASAIQGYADAQRHLGDLYNDGDLVDFDPAIALSWYRMAAQQGHARAQYDSAMHYEHGVGVHQDLLKAIKYYKLSANQGYPRAQSYFESAKRWGNFSFYMSVDSLESYLAIQKAAKEGDAEKQFDLACLYTDEDLLGKNPPKAVKYFKMATENGHDAAPYYLGRYYEKGKTVPQDFSKALEYYKLSAERGDDEAQLYLARYYEEGEDVPQDMAEAIKYYTMAADQENSDAEFILGVFYELGEVVPQDFGMAFKYYKMAADNDDVDAQLIVAMMYEQGVGVQESISQAFIYYEAAAREKNAEAQFILGTFYEDGEVVPQDLKEAIGLYKKAAAQGDPDAIEALAEMNEG